MSEYEGSSTIFLQPEEFAQDAQPPRLGRANGNTYQRKLGVEGMHDGQIMVRLKKKRFIIIDYGYIPNANFPHNTRRPSLTSAFQQEQEGPSVL